jgi:8-oxo-dGTP diphosphatase
MTATLEVVTALIHDSTGRVLLGQRKPTSLRPGMWESPGGKVELGEGHLYALRRELREELACECQFHHKLARVSVPFELGYVDLYLYGVTLKGEPLPIVHTELRWVDYGEAIKYLPLVPSGYLFYPAVKSYLKSKGFPR